MHKVMVQYSCSDHTVVASYLDTKLSELENFPDTTMCETEHSKM